MLTVSTSELKNRVGQPLGESQPHTITQDQVNEFADATGDHQWLHVDVQRAKQGPYHGTVAHGFLTLSLLPALMDECVRVTDAKAMVSMSCSDVVMTMPLPRPSGWTAQRQRHRTPTGHPGGSACPTWRPSRAPQREPELPSARRLDPDPGHEPSPTRSLAPSGLRA
jgi:MaoC like domain